MAKVERTEAEDMGLFCIVASRVTPHISDTTYCESQVKREVCSKMSGE